MKMYQTQHPFYCGIDLHANQMYACVVDHNGKKRLHHNYKTRNANKFFEELEPFGCDIAIGCESTFNWYWLADACRERKLPFILGHALYLKAIHGGKVKNDKLDSEKLALKTNRVVRTRMLGGVGAGRRKLAPIPIHIVIRRSFVVCKLN